MNHKLFHIDAFTNKVFSGNSACVVVLGCEISDKKLLKIAAENGVAETAFILAKNGRLNLRWFTPDLEMDLCGHATLASAYVVFNFMREFVIMDKVVFATCEGNIEVYREKNENAEYMFCLNFPVREGVKSQLPLQIQNSLSIQPVEVYKSRDYHLVYNTPQEILDIKVNRTEFDKINLGTGGVVVSARGPHKEEKCYNEIGKCDFVSRFFTPQATILEDPVTGSAHCTLAPYWAQKLNNSDLRAKQISARGGELSCTLQNGRVIIKGCAVCYLTGEIFV